LTLGCLRGAVKLPRLRRTNPQELFNVDRKPITEGLARLPATYDELRPDKTIEGKGERQPRLAPNAPKLTSLPANDLLIEAERVEKARQARMEGQARESQVFFRLALRAAAREGTNPEAHPDSGPRSTAT